MSAAIELQPYALAALPLAFIRRHRLAAMGPWTPRLAAGSGLVLLMRLASGSRLPLAFLASSGDRRLLARGFRSGLLVAVAVAVGVSNTEAGGCRFALRLRFAGLRLLVLVALCLFGGGDFGGFEHAVHLRLLG